MTNQRQAAARNGTQTSSSAPAIDSADAELAALAERAAAAESRIARLGVPKSELARAAGLDRGTMARALKADPRTLANDARTWVKLERALSEMEEEVGFDAPGSALVRTAESDDAVTSTVEKDGARITLSGRADAVAEAIRKVLQD